MPLAIGDCELVVTAFITTRARSINKRATSTGCSRQRNIYPTQWHGKRARKDMLKTLSIFLGMALIKTAMHSSTLMNKTRIPQQPQALKNNLEQEGCDATYQKEEQESVSGADKITGCVPL
ncbi:predicted protein [Lichtheimia corymbifera JMRC:FSU:9682]|uniref:Uncharacterized protein n=1 Tax=Lichtheimia corymbifera JMRC:FSU:9682 TaxID=1263082 RepID=A0A068RFU0_9FUNG|nr:predicted protein [Lichtheimia corymbifera JMRC:FSU:9682]